MGDFIASALLLLYSWVARGKVKPRWGKIPIICQACHGRLWVYSLTV